MYIVYNNVVLLLGYSSMPPVRQDDQSIDLKTLVTIKKEFLGQPDKGS